MSQSFKFVLLIFIYLIVAIIIVSVAKLDLFVSSLLITTGLFISAIVLTGIQFLSQKIEKTSKRIIQDSTASYQQIESLFSIYSSLNIENILPPFRGWAISPDFASLLLTKMKQTKPANILECGSGISTILIAYYIKNTNKGHLYSYENDKNYAEATVNLLKQHNLDQYATVIYSPLVEHVINGKEWKWYDIEKINKNVFYDLVVIDGPPFQIQPKSRYPTLPLLDKYINSQATILIDDCSRPQDNEVIQDWMIEFDGYNSKWFDTEKGAYALTKQ